jgi:hypothetical protein
MIAKSTANWREIGDESTPVFATATDIAIAEKLRHELERRYFGSPDVQAAPPLCAVDVH